MQVTLDPGAIVIGVITVLLVIIQGFIVMWVSNTKKDIDSLEKFALKLQTEQSTFREHVGREYIPRSEVYSQRAEYAETLRNIDQKLTTIVSEFTNKLERKQDK